MMTGPRCRSKFTDEEIGLLDIESFKLQAPEHFLSGIEDPHELQLQRLAFEKLQRQELVRGPAVARLSEEMLTECAVSACNVESRGCLRLLKRILC